MTLTPEALLWSGIALTCLIVGVALLFLATHLIDNHPQAAVYVVIVAFVILAISGITGTLGRLALVGDVVGVVHI